MNRYGLTSLLIHLGATIIGNFSTKSRTISKDAEPDPIMILERKTVVFIGLSINIFHIDA